MGPVLPSEPLPHAAMDYARLREEGLGLLIRLAGGQWTDFNTHDPGVTLLEQLCYAITDLGYRIAFPVDELVGDRDLGLPAPEAALTTDPVTAADLRKLALDVEGVGNAWVEAVGEPEVAFYFHSDSRELRLRPHPADPDAAPIVLRGLQRVVLQTTEQVSGETALAAVAMRLHRSRGLGGDVEVALLRTFPIGIVAAIEVAEHRGAGPRPGTRRRARGSAARARHGRGPARAAHHGVRVRPPSRDPRRAGGEGGAVAGAAGCRRADRATASTSCASTSD
jgi:hypothetical protein